MSALIGHWLFSLQPLPIEGVGELFWELRPAVRNVQAATIESPRWEVIFRSDSATRLPEDFFIRLACFANTSVQDVELQYRNWLRLFQSTPFAVQVFGAGELKKESVGQIEWNPNQNTLAAAAPVKILPFSSEYLHRRWDLFDRLVLMITGIALAFTTILVLQKGLKVDLTGSSWPVKQVLNKDAQLPYREIR